MSLPSRVGDFVRSLSRVQRELAVLGIAAFLGFVVMPGVTWAIGIVVFKIYAGGNTVFSLYGNFYKALATGSPVFWIVAAGPYLMIMMARLLVAVFRGGSQPATAAAPTPAPQPRRRAPQLPDDLRATPDDPGARRSAGVKASSPSPTARPAAAPNRAPPAPSRTSQPNRTPPPPEPPAPQPPRKAPPKPGERRTPFIKSID